MKTGFFNIFFLVIVFSFFIISCESEEVLQLEESTELLDEAIPVGVARIDELPDLANIILETSNKSKVNWTSKSDGEGIILDESRILSVTDSIGNVSYSIRMYVPDSPYNVFHNVIVKQRPDGGFNQPMVLRYEIDKEYYVEYRVNDRRDTPFKGSIYMYATSTFFEDNSLFGRWDDEPCITANTGDGDGSSGSGDGSGGGNNGSGGNGGYDSHGFGDTPDGWWDAPDNGGGSGGGGIGTVEIGEGDFGKKGTDGILKRNLTGKDEDCPEDELLFPINEEDVVTPSCESFDFYTVGGTGVQVAGVDGIWDVVTRWGRCPGIGVAASYQTYYFHLPSYLNSGLAAERSADALEGAFYDLQKWFERQPCSQMNTGVLAVKMDEFIKDNFEDIGGQATRNAPYGWNGTSRKYIEDWSGNDKCY